MTSEKEKRDLFIDNRSWEVFANRDGTSQYVCTKHRTPITKSIRQDFYCKKYSHWIKADFDYQGIEIINLKSPDDEGVTILPVGEVVE